MFRSKQFRHMSSERQKNRHYLNVFDCDSKLVLFITKFSKCLIFCFVFHLWRGAAACIKQKKQCAKCNPFFRTSICFVSLSLSHSVCVYLTPSLQLLSVCIWSLEFFLPVITFTLYAMIQRVWPINATHGVCVCVLCMLHIEHHIKLLHKCAL